MITYADRRFAVQGPFATFNIGTGVETSLNQLLAAFERVAGQPVARQCVPARHGEGQRIPLDASEARRWSGQGHVCSLAAMIFDPTPQLQTLCTGAIISVFGLGRSGTAFRAPSAIRHAPQQSIDDGGV